MTDTTDIAALRPAERAKLGFVTDDNTGGYYVAECEECGQIFPSQTCDGGGQIADTGDYGDCYCPHCGHVDPEVCENANLVWNVQQLKIINLTSQLEAERQRAENWSVSFENERFRADKLAAHIETLKGDQVPVAITDDMAMAFHAATTDSSLGREDMEEIKVGLKAVQELLTAPQKPVVPYGLHQQTAKLVIEFATALAEKLYKAEQKYGFSDTWIQPDWKDKCLADFTHHISKGDPRDVAAYCAFMWYHGWPTAIESAGGVVKDGE